MYKTIDDFDVVIGLEVHIQLTTKSKLFNSDAAHYGANANEHISAITLAHPGTLPRINQEAIQQAIKLGLSLNCAITNTNLFSRKHYMYPDLPKGFQTTQHLEPICVGGHLTVDVNGIEKTIDLDHIHLEEDAGKSIHDTDPTFTAIDYNRAGTPLCELVTTPCISNADEAYAFLTALRKLVRWIAVSDGNMEEGSIRCDANVSIKPKGAIELGTRVEVKNLNSFKNVKKAIDIEVARMLALINNGETIEQQTRSFDAATETTFSLRSKEDAMDYRYFIEPDLSPVIVSAAQIAAIKNDLPKLPQELVAELEATYALSKYDAKLLTDDISCYHLFKSCIAIYNNAKSITNYINGPIRNYCNDKNIEIEQLNISATQIVEMLQLVETNKISFNTAGNKLLHLIHLSNGGNVNDIANKNNLIQQSDNTQIEEWISEVIAKNEIKVLEYKKGKKGLIGFFMGEVVKLSKGKAEPKTTQILLQSALDK